MIKILNDPKKFRQIQLVSVVVSAGPIIVLQQYAKLNLFWVAISLCTGFAMALYLRYQTQLNLPKYGLWLLPIIFILLLNSNISTHPIALSTQALLFTFLGLNLSYRFLPQRKVNP
ncbi:hypothetical protein [Acinetobacter boissieri]|uniref:Uncharacterized protein n=1 Tax=Acinetobacter boissieri TaxID=1219383 RepID=A0A1G6J6Q5_9GAMM|nr:hypothetical protein [Acinetobacter boissieri]SDC14371.1 hypothetical protein SAMN05421733_11039 [Acinetobacter boissieri]